MLCALMPSDAHHLVIENVQLRYNLIRPPLHMGSVADRNVITWHMTVITYICEYLDSRAGSSTNVISNGFWMTPQY